MGIGDRLNRIIRAEVTARENEALDPLQLLDEMIAETLLGLERLRSAAKEVAVSINFIEGDIFWLGERIKSLELDAKSKLFQENESGARRILEEKKQLVERQKRLAELLKEHKSSLALAKDVLREWVEKENSVREQRARLVDRQYLADANILVHKAISTLEDDERLKSAFNQLEESVAHSWEQIKLDRELEQGSLEGRFRALEGKDDMEAMRRSQEVQKQHGLSEKEIEDLY